MNEPTHTLEWHQPCRDHGHQGDWHLTPAGALAGTPALAHASLRRDATPKFLASWVAAQLGRPVALERDTGTSRPGNPKTAPIYLVHPAGGAR